MAVEEVYTNSFNARLVEWSEWGISPYLHDTDVDWIVTILDAVTEGDWGFPASVGSGTINSVKLRVEHKTSKVGAGDVDVFVWNGSEWLSVGIITSGLAYAWTEFNVSAILNSWAKINNALVYVVYTKTLVGSQYVRRLTRKVDYTVVSTVLRRNLVGVGL